MAKKSYTTDNWYDALEAVIREIKLWWAECPTTKPVFRFPADMVMACPCDVPFSTVNDTARALVQRCDQAANRATGMGPATFLMYNAAFEVLKTKEALFVAEIRRIKPWPLPAVVIVELPSDKEARTELS